MIDTLTRSIGDQDMLIVVDNCEHLIEPAARLVDALGGCRRVKVLATSRQALGIGGETTWRVPSLSLPADNAAGGTDERSTSEAVELFCDRAGLVRPGFRLGEDNSVAVEAICRRLDGIPLAIELAAARTNTFTPAQIAHPPGRPFPLAHRRRPYGPPSAADPASVGRLELRAAQ